MNTERLAEIEDRVDQIVDALQTDRSNAALRAEMERLIAEHSEILHRATH